MPVRLVTFDCANTLLKGNWDPIGFALWAAREAGLCLPKRAGEEYGALLHRHYPTILEVSRTGDYPAVQSAYVELGREWMSQLGLSPELAVEVVKESAELLFTPDSGLFEPFDDVLPTLRALKERNIHLAVVSNWDASLAGVLKAHGLYDWFDEVYASLVVGAEKPDPKMIDLAIAAAGVTAEETLHVGDDVFDDLGAARAAKVRGLIIDRRGPSTESYRISSLSEVFEWID